MDQEEMHKKQETHTVVKKMQTSNVIRIVRAASWRLFRWAVVVPASLVGTCLLVMTLIGLSPIQEAVSSIYEWADTQVRSAPEGHVQVTGCAPGDFRTLHHPVCKKRTVRSIPIADHAAETLKTFYVGYLIILLWTASFGLPGWMEKDSASDIQKSEALHLSGSAQKKPEA